MIKYFISSQEKRLIEIPELKKDCWIHLEAPTAEEISLVSSLTGISESFIKSATDEEEAAHIDSDGDVKMVVIDIPKTVEKGDSASILTMPLALIQNEKYLITVCTMPTTVLNDFFQGRLKNIDTSLRTKLMYQIMYNNSSRFLYYLRQIDKSSDHIQKNLAKSMQNKEIFQFLELQKTLVFFSASLTANYAVINKISNTAVKADEEERAIIEDVIIENKQALEMCTIYREIIKSTMDAFASVVNNNQNIVMKILTVITIILAIPTLISGFWGMNTGVPFEGRIWGFWVTIGISLIISAIVTIFMVKKKLF